MYRTKPNAYTTLQKWQNNEVKSVSSPSLRWPSSCETRTWPPWLAGHTLQMTWLVATQTHRKTHVLLHINICVHKDIVPLTGSDAWM